MRMLRVKERTKGRNQSSFFDLASISISLKQIIGNVAKNIFHLVDEAAEKIDDDDKQRPVVDDEVDADEDQEEEPDDHDEEDYEEEGAPPGVLLSIGHRRLPNLPGIKRGSSCFLPHSSQRLKKIHR